MPAPVAAEMARIDRPASRRGEDAGACWLRRHASRVQAVDAAVAFGDAHSFDRPSRAASIES